MTAILDRGDVVPDRDWSWDIDGGEDLMQGGYPLKVTGERRDARGVHVDGIHREEKTWVPGDLIVFRDHIATFLVAYPLRGKGVRR